MRVSERGVGERQRGRGKAGKRKEGEGRKGVYQQGGRGEKELTFGANSPNPSCR